MAREAAKNKARTVESAVEDKRTTSGVKVDESGASVADTLTSDNERAGVEADAEKREADLKVYSHTGLDDPNYDHVDPRTDAEIEASSK